MLVLVLTLVIAAEPVADLSSPDEGIRADAARQIGNMPGDESIKALLGAIKDISPAVQIAAIQSLGGFGTDANEATKPLISLFRSDKDRAVRNAALSAAVETGWGTPEILYLCLEIARGAPSGRTKPLGKGKYEEHRFWAVETLGAIGPDAERAVPLILDLLKASAASPLTHERQFRTCLQSLKRIGSDKHGVIGVLKGLRDGKGYSGEGFPIDSPLVSQKVSQARVLADTTLRKLQEAAKNRKAPQSDDDALDGDAAK